MTARHPAGTSDGGRFAPGARARSTVALEPTLAGGRGQVRQTTEPIHRLRMRTNNRPLGWLLSMAAEDHGLDLNPPYQRGLVWDTARKQLLIRSMLEGVPIPSMIVNDRMAATRFTAESGLPENWAYAVVDGKQRASAILGFAGDEYPIPASWLPAELVAETAEQPDGPYVYWSGLTEMGRRFFKMDLTIGVAEGEFGSLEDEEEIFNRVNFGGVAQGDSDLEESR